MTMGLPRCGKSTWVTEHMRRTNAVVVNPDAIRLALTGQRFVLEAEPQVWAIARMMVRALFLAGHETVILDSTNTYRARRDEWLAEWKDKVNVVYVLFHTAVETCKTRAINSEQVDLLPVIDRMWEQWEWPLYPETDGLTVVNGDVENSHDLVETLTPNV